MRLWSLHPKYLDARGLVALWREALLAQKVLQGQTKGYRNHPQLERFRRHPTAVSAMATYLQAIYEEGQCRGYHFAPEKIVACPSREKIPLTRGQLLYERQHLLHKLIQRDPIRYQDLFEIALPEPHPLFELQEGDVEPWEVAAFRQIFARVDE